MQYLDKLKKERSIDRVIFLAGMCLAFIGFLVPTVYVKQIVTVADLTTLSEATLTEAVDSTSEDEYALTTEDSESSEEGEDAEGTDDELAESDDDEFASEDEDLAFDDEESEEDVEREFDHFASRKAIVTDYKKNLQKDIYGNYETNPDGSIKFEYILDKSGNKIIETTVSYDYVIVDAEVEENDEGHVVRVLENGKPKYSYVLDFDKNGVRLEDDDTVHIDQATLEQDFKIEKNIFNLFGVLDVFNQTGKDYGDFDYIPGTAYNATFMVIVWLCTIAGIILFFVAKSIIGDVIVLLLAIAFGLAASFCIPLTLGVPFVTGSFFVGAYLVAAGLIASLVGTLLGAAHIKHPDQAKVN